MNFQDWKGFTDGRFGYGAMLSGFIDHKPEGVVIDPKGSVSVHMGVPFSCKGFFGGQYRVLFSMWETTRLPSRFAAWLSQYDEVLVPCAHNVAVFGDFHPKVSHLPLGVDTGLWRPLMRSQNPIFRFHAAGSLWWRKGLDRVVEAFAASGLDAELHLKVAPHAKDVPAGPWPERVFFHREWMDLEAQVDWFRQADCFIAASRGEGFGLIPLQAIAAGVPTIITATSGQAQFAHLAQIVTPHVPKPANGYGGGDWDDPTLDGLVDAMRDMVTHHRRYVDRAQRMASKADEFSWDAAARKLVAHLPTGLRLTDPVWKDCDVQVGVRVNRVCQASINGKERHFRPDTDYTVPEQMFILLRDAGYVAV